MDRVYQGGSIGQRALDTMGKVLKVNTIQPWFFFLPPPVSDNTEAISYKTAIIIANAFSQLTPAMGDFAMMMAEKGWIDAKPTPNRSTN